MLKFPASPPDCSPLPKKEYRYAFRPGVEADTWDEDFIRAGGFPHYVLEADGQKVCQCMLRDEPGHPEVFEIRDFETKPKEKRKGHATRFEQELEKVAKEQGCTVMWAYDVDGDEAEAFWTSVGFTFHYRTADERAIWTKAI